VSALLLSVAVMIGAALQRIGGVGFALVAAPFLVLVLGPIQGVVLTNILAVATAAFTTVLTFRSIEYRRTAPLLLVAAVAVIPGALIVKSVPASLLAVITGSLIVGALTLSFGARRLRKAPTIPALIIGGGLSGFMSVVAGSAGPGAVSYAVATRWPHERFVVSVQFYLMCLGSVSLVMRGVPPELNTAEWAGALVGLPLGVGLGQLLAGRISPRFVRLTTYLLAYVGAFWVITRGVQALLF
jgi:uncharacterized membrane protein YfcA